jgi:LGFP repeat
VKSTTAISRIGTANTSTRYRLFSVTISQYGIRTMLMIVFLLSMLVPVSHLSTVQAASRNIVACGVKVEGAIGLKYEMSGGASGALGCPKPGGEIRIPNLGVYATYREFMNGAIYHYRGTGEYLIWGDIYRKWLDDDQEKFWGFPVSDVLTGSDGRSRYVHFERGTLVYKDGQIQGYYPSYYFMVNSYRIDRTRSRDNDTNNVYISAQNGGFMDSKIRDMGDQDDGFYTVGMSQWIHVTDLDAPIVFSYIITNSGHRSSAETKEELDIIVPETAAIMASHGGKIGVIVGGVVTIGYELVKDLIFADCDGIVADAIINTDLRMLARWTANQTKHTETHFHPGYDSNAGCGRNSKYTATWTVGRWAP